MRGDSQGGSVDKDTRPLPDWLRPPAGKVLNRWGRRFWKDIAGDLYRANLLKSNDIATFTMLCQSYGLAMEAAVKIAEEGLFRQDENNVTRKHPSHQVWRDSTATFNRIADKFALNPKSRQAMKVDTSDADEFDLFLARRPGSGMPSSIERLLYDVVDARRTASDDQEEEE